MNSLIVAKRGRPKATADAEPRRQALVLAAYRRVAKQGFEGLRTRDIAADVGVNVATLHYYFRTKEALIRAVVDHAMERFRTTFVPGRSPGAQLQAHFRGVLRLVRPAPAPVARGRLPEGDPADGAQGQPDGLRAIERPRLDPDATAALVTATFRGTFMLPSASTRHLEGALRQLEKFIGIASGKQQ